MTFMVSHRQEKAAPTDVQGRALLRTAVLKYLWGEDRL